MLLQDMIYSRIPSFASLHELVLNRTVMFPYTYTVLVAVLTLRSLNVQKCTTGPHPLRARRLVVLPLKITSARNSVSTLMPPAPAFHHLPILHLPPNPCLAPQARAPPVPPSPPHHHMDQRPFYIILSLPLPVI